MKVGKATKANDTAMISEDCIISGAYLHHHTTLLLWNGKNFHWSGTRIHPLVTLQPPCIIFLRLANQYTF